ncbi:MAG: hypothetical protein ACFFGZ_00565 [Candidatus Thorarchaeota archaeon]
MLTSRTGLLVEFITNNGNSDQSKPEVQDFPRSQQFKPMEKAKPSENDQEGILTYIIGGILAIIFAIAGFLAFIVPQLIKIVILLVVLRILAEPLIIIYDHLMPDYGVIGAIGLLIMFYFAIPIIGGAISYYGRRMRDKDLEFNSDEIVMIFLGLYLLSWVIAFFLGISF